MLEILLKPKQICLLKYLSKTFRISRARRVVENAFGILSSRFRIFRNPILQNYPNAVKSVKAAVVLHNYIMMKCNSQGQYFNSSEYRRENESGDIIPGHWEHDAPSNNLFSLSRLCGNRSGTLAAREQRSHIANAMITDGLAPWQFYHAFRCKWFCILVQHK